MDYYHQVMKKEMPKIQVKDVQTDQVLFECALSESEKAYHFAAEMEEMGLDIKVVNPTLSETLTTSLGLNQEEVAAYEASMEQEMDEHAGSCCFEDADEKKTVH